MRAKLISRESLSLGGFICSLTFILRYPTSGYSLLKETSATPCKSLLPNRRCRPHFMTSLLATKKEEFTNEGRVNLISMQDDAVHSNGAEILSKDPLVYVVSNFLSVEECQSYQEYVQNLSDRNMTRSNPPDVSLDVSRLWPLPLLSLLAGIPPVIHVFAEEPQAVSFSSFVQMAVPNIATALAMSGILAYGVVLPLLRQISKHSSRTSVAVALNTEADHDFVRPLVDKIDKFTKHPWMNWEAPVVTRYDPGAIFSRHGDASPIRGEEWKENGGQRVITCICYLNTLQEGGETYFDRLDIAVKPEAGKALFFFPADGVTWNADDRTTHESKPPGFEDKWIVQMFGRAQRVPPPLGLAITYSCTDR